MDLSVSLTLHTLYLSIPPSVSFALARIRIRRRVAENDTRDPEKSHNFMFINCLKKRTENYGLIGVLLFFSRGIFLPENTARLT